MFSTMEKEESVTKSRDEECKQVGELGMKSERRSQREKKNKRSFSPEPEDDRKKRRKRTRPFSNTSSSRPCDLLPDGQPFCCKMCKSPYVTNPYAKGVRKSKRSRHVPLPKKRLDSLGREILVCNACSQILDRQIKPNKPSRELSAVERNQYLEDAKMFAKSLAESLNEPEAEKLYCPVSIYKICGCLQKYIKGTDIDEESLALRVAELLNLTREAAKLREQKAYILPENADISCHGNKRSKFIGFGNGHKKSKEFEEFVLKNRQLLKEELRLCERATQKILLYSNNFLHKKLKTEERLCRITRTKGKAALGKLDDIDTLHEQNCCIDRCVRLSLTHPNLLKSWRDRAVSGQMEARKVIAEMLTPAGGYRLNCYQFVSMVTGCALTTIGKVNNQIRVTGGRQDPPEHGMKKVWTDGHRNRMDMASATSDDQLHESQLAHTQAETRPEMSPEMLRNVPNQIGSISANVHPSLQQDMLKIQELMKKQHELQQQQQLVQYQLQQTLGQNSSWIPQFIGQQSHSIGSSNSAFYPARNLPQSNLPLFVPSVSSLPLNQDNIEQLQPLLNQPPPTGNLNIPILSQFASSSSQNSPFSSNQVYAALNQDITGKNPQNSSSYQYQPLASHSVRDSYQLQPVIDETYLQRKNNPGEQTPSTQSVNKTPTSCPRIDKSALPSLRPPQPLSTHGDKFLKIDPLAIRSVQAETGDIDKSPEFTVEPLIISAADSVSPHIAIEKQVKELNPTGTESSNDIGRAAPRMILTIIDPEKGISQQIEIPNATAETPLILPVGNSASSTNLYVPDTGNFSSPAEQVIVNNVQIEVPVGGNITVDKLNSETVDSSTAVEVSSLSDGVSNRNRQYEVTNDTEQRIDNNIPAHVISLVIPTMVENNLPNTSLPSTVPLHLEQVDLMLQPVTASEGQTDITARRQVIPKLADKSTNTGIIQMNEDDLDKSEAHLASEYKTQSNLMNSAYTDTTIISRTETNPTSKILTNHSEISKRLGSVNSSSSVRMPFLLPKPPNMKEVRKHDRKQHRPRHKSREQGFQKLQSKNGKVFLHSSTQHNLGSGETNSAPGNINSGTSSFSNESSDTDATEKVSNENTEVSNNDTVLSRVQSKNVSEARGMKRSRKESHITEKVKNKLRKSLNVPILPKPQKSEQSVIRLPLELQPLQSSLFVVPQHIQRPQATQNITSMIHMSKSKVQIQPPVPSQGSHDHMTVPCHSSVSGRDELNTTETSSNDTSSNISGVENDSLSMYRSHQYETSLNETSHLPDQTVCVKDNNEIESFPGTRNSVSGSTARSLTELMTIGHLPQAFLQNITLSYPTVQNPVYSTNANHSLAIVNKTDGQSFITLPFHQSLKASQLEVNTPLLVQQNSDKNRKTSTHSISHPNLQVSSKPDFYQETLEGGNHSPSRLVELSSDLIQQGIQDELNLFKETPD